MVAYAFSQPWLSMLNGPQDPNAREWAHLLSYLKGIDSGSIPLFNPHLQNSTIDSFTAGGNINMNSFKLTSLAAGTTNGDSLRYEQLINLYLLLTGGTLTGQLFVQMAQPAGGLAQLILNNTNAGVGTAMVFQDNGTGFAFLGEDKLINNSSNTNFIIQTNTGRGINFQVNGSTTNILVIGSNGLSTFAGNIAFAATSTQGIVGSTTNDNAATGNVGEKISSSVTAGTVASPGTGQWFDITSISLTAGDWNVTGIVELSQLGSTGTEFLGGIGTATGNNGAGLVEGDTMFDSAFPTANNDVVHCIADVRKSLSSTTTIYLKAQAVFSVGGPPKGGGRIIATRSR